MNEELRGEREPPLQNYLTLTQIERREEDKPLVEFQGHYKVNGFPNVTLPLVVTATIENHDVSRILVDGGSSCDVMYLKIFMTLG